MRKLIAGATIALIVSGAGGTAFAGEVTGGPSPKPTPINDFGHAQSICAFSGQNDDPTGAGGTKPLEVGRTQNWGQTQANALAISPEELANQRATRAPSITCNGNTGIIASIPG
jgi:hypothetical protein